MTNGNDNEPDREAIAAGIAAIWERTRGTVLTRVETINAAASAANENSLTSTARHAAFADAHKLSGYPWTFGFGGASKLAAEAEGLLRGEEPLPAGAITRLTDIAVELQHQLTAERAA
ncbi:MAG: hypothetical protein ABI442_02395 [Gemmatimonadaceae bacterium]